MNAKVIALASALVATTALASAAEAGGGVRLGFGGPLGTFVATPSHGGGGAYHGPGSRKKAPAAQASRKPEKSQHVVKADPAPKAAADKAETTAQETAPVTGSSALIQGSIPAQDEGSAGTAEHAESQAETEHPSAGSTVTAEAPAEAANCKKFVPAIGTTVTVGCEK
ncbi:hypothetical protein [uncultured Hyphomicrobium sp.]|uniref:hypothetical protein n=1 Tax=uncultured Hyphomicrobium sp. TaxID=194373 RepID=UPI0025F4DFDD|nr:hypothetical protein [uncultured Hyphomicrobium sp.]